MLWQCCPIGNWKKWKHTRKKGTPGSSLYCLLWKFNETSQGILLSPNMVENMQVFTHLWISGYPRKGKNTWPLINYKTNWRETPLIPPIALLVWCEIACWWSLISGYPGCNDGKVERRGWFEGLNWVERRGRFKGLNWVFKVSSWEVFQETEV